MNFHHIGISGTIYIVAASLLRSSNKYPLQSSDGRWMGEETVTRRVSHSGNPTWKEGSTINKMGKGVSES